MTLEEIYTRLLCAKNTDNMNCQHILTLDITTEDLVHVNASSQARDYVNQYLTKTNAIGAYQRNNPTDINLKSMIGEQLLQVKLMQESRKGSRAIKYRLEGPAIAAILLEKNKPDFLVQKDTGFPIMFDVKSNWSSANWLNINEKSHDRLKLMNDFYLLCLIEKENEPKKAHYIAMPNKFFDAHKIYEGSGKSPYFKVAMQKIISSSGVKV